MVRNRESAFTDQINGEESQEEYMKRKKITALMLAGVLMTSGLMAGCSSSNDIDVDAVVATLNDQDIKLGLVNFIARYQQAGMDDMYTAYFGEDVWTQDLYGNGTTMEQSTKDSVMENLELMYLLEDHMSDYNVEITDADTEAMKQAAADFMESNSQQAINQMGATEEYIQEMLRLMTIQEKMYQAITGEVDTEVSDEEAQQRTFSYVTISKESYTDEEGNTVEYTEDELTTLADTVATLAETAATDYDTAMSDAGYTVSTHSYDANPDLDEYSDDETMDDAVIEAADALTEGQVSGVVDTDTAYYILRLDSENDADAMASRKEAIISSRQSAHYTEVTDGYKEDVKWSIDSDVWNTVQFDSLFTVKQEETQSSTDVSE